MRENIERETDFPAPARPHFPPNAQRPPANNEEQLKLMQRHFLANAQSVSEFRTLQKKPTTK